MTRTRVVLILLTCLLLTSCRYGSSEKPSTNEEVPNMMLSNASYTFGDKESNSVYVTADKITIYDEKTDFEKVALNQEDIEASCDRAMVIDNNKISLEGNVVVKALSDDAQINCKDLYWDNSTKTISTDSAVEINYSDDSHVKARKFETNLSEGTYEFKDISDAVFVVDDETSFDIATSSFEYNSKTEKLTADGYFHVSEIGKDTVLSGTRLEFLQESSILTITDGANFTKQQEDGHISCKANNLTYNSQTGTLNIDTDVSFTKNLESGDLTCKTQEAFYDINEGILTVDSTVNFLKQEGDGEISCEAGNLTYNSKEGFITIAGGVSFSKSLDDGVLTCHTEDASYDLNGSVLKIENSAKFTKESETENTITCTSGSLEYDIANTTITMSNNVSFSKDTDDGLLQCTSQSMTYNTKTQILIIKDNAQVTWGKNKYGAEEIKINLNTEKVYLTGKITGEIYG